MSNSETEKTFDAASVRSERDANHQETLPEGTEQTDTVQTQPKEGEPLIDYREKFSHSSKEAQRLLDENKRLQDELNAREQATTQTTQEQLYPGFENLDPEQQENLLNYTRAVEQSVLQKINANPVFSHATQTYNEKKWNDAFEKVSTKYPELTDTKSDFKQKYFQPHNVPENIDTILEDVAKIYLFDKVKDQGAEEERKRSNRIDTERAHGGDKTQPSSRTLEEWNQMATENPVKFAKLTKEYHADLEAGKLKE